MTVRIHPYVSEMNHARLTALSRQPRQSVSTIVDVALTNYFASSPDGVGGHALLRRLDTVTRQIGRLEEKDLIIGETLALFIRYFMMTTPPVPADRQEVARAAGDLRFESFLEQLGIDLQSGKRILEQVVRNLFIDETDLFTDAELDRLHQPAPTIENGEVHDA
ncbi:MAG: hypothetical protein AAFY34_09880 [Pseudomonadota bacterium]